MSNVLNTSLSEAYVGERGAIWYSCWSCLGNLLKRAARGSCGRVGVRAVGVCVGVFAFFSIPLRGAGVCDDDVVVIRLGDVSLDVGVRDGSRGRDNSRGRDTSRDRSPNDGNPPGMNGRSTGRLALASMLMLPFSKFLNSLKCSAYFVVFWVELVS